MKSRITELTEQLQEKDVSMAEMEDRLKKMQDELEAKEIDIQCYDNHIENIREMLIDNDERAEIIKYIDMIENHPELFVDLGLA